MWFWCNSPFAAMWWIFPIMFLFCMVMMFLCMRMFFGGQFRSHFKCCSPLDTGWKDDKERESRSDHYTERGQSGDKR